jgi:uncharacterized protein YjbI with pentapeptide repeats
MSKVMLWGLGAASLLLGCASKDDGEPTALERADAGGPPIVESRIDEPPGPNCEFGGVAIASGIDRNDDGEVRGREVDDTRYECEDAPVLESRLLITELDVGHAECPGGGTKMDRGTDTNQNGALDLGEVESTDFLCNPVIEPESRLIITTLEVGDDECPGGGSKLERGADLNADGEVRGREVESTDLICNEVQAPPVLARVQELELGGEDCPDGGFAVLTGPDTDGDGLLSDDEASERSLVCDDPELVITCAIPYVWSEEASGCLLETDWSGAELAEADLSSVYLAGIDFSDADLGGATLSDAELRNADMTGANLAAADLSNAGLSGTDFTGASLNGTDMTGVDLSHAILDGISAIDLKACPEVLPEEWRCPDFGASGFTLTWPGMSLAGLDLTGAELELEDLYGLSALGIAGCPAQLPEGWVCTELGDFGQSLFGPGADFSDFDLAGVDLSEATDLQYTSFNDADLSGASFGANTDLAGSSFIGTDLTGATFGPGTSLRGAVIKGANLAGVDLSDTDLAGVHAVGLASCPQALPSPWACVDSASGLLLAGPYADLSGMDLLGADLSGLNLVGVDFSYGSLEGATLEGADLSDATLYVTHTHDFVGCPVALPADFVCREDVLLGPYVDLTSVDLSNREFGDVDLMGALLPGANLSGTQLQGANLREADLRYTNLTGTDLSGVDLGRANLSGATVSETLLGEAFWELTICPDGSLSGVGFDQGCFLPE